MTLDSKPDSTQYTPASEHGGPYYQHDFSPKILHQNPLKNIHGSKEIGLPLKSKTFAPITLCIIHRFEILTVLERRNI